MAFQLQLLTFPTLVALRSSTWRLLLLQVCPMATVTRVSSPVSASVSDGQLTTNIVDDMVQALEGRIGGLLENAVDAHLSMLLPNVNSTQPQTLTTTSVSSPSFVDDLTQRAIDLASIGSSSLLAAFDSAAAGTSTGMPRMVNCLANSRCRIAPNFINTLCARSTSVNVVMPKQFVCPRACRYLPTICFWMLSPALTTTHR